MNKLPIYMALLFLTIPVMAAPNLEDATKDVCKCLKQPQNKLRQAVELIKKAQSSGGMSQIMAAQGDMMGVIKASTRCFEALPEKYPEINRSNELKKRVMVMAKTQCPNPVFGLSKQR